MLMNYTDRKKDKKITFEKFLCGIPARDYINQPDNYEKQISAAARLIRNSDYVLIGAGAGMSTAAGAKYGGTFFEEEFAEFLRIWFLNVRFAVVLWI